MKQRRYIGQDIFTADQIVGKTLIARTSVPIKRYAQASAPVVFTAKPGQTVGRVYSWVMEGTTLWWQFLDEYNKPYYAQHKPGLFSVSALQQQGAQTLEDIKEAQEKAENPIAYTLSKLFQPVALGLGLFFVVKALK